MVLLPVVKKINYLIEGANTEHAYKQQETELEPFWKRLRKRKQCRYVYS